MAIHDAIGFAGMATSACAVSAFIWLPLVFAAFAIGRRQCSLRFIFLATASEAIALAGAAWFVTNLDW